MEEHLSRGTPSHLLGYFHILVSLQETAGLVLREQDGSWTPGICMQDSMRFLYLTHFSI